jgi:hypothetical protein
MLATFGGTLRARWSIRSEYQSSSDPRVRRFLFPSAARLGRSPPKPRIVSAPLRLPLTAVAPLHLLCFHSDALKRWDRHRRPQVSEGSTWFPPRLTFLFPLGLCPDPQPSLTMIYTSSYPSVPIPHIDLDSFLFSPSHARRTNSPSNLALVDSSLPPSSSLTLGDVQAVSRELGAGLTKLWSQGITPLIPSSPLPLASSSSLSSFSKEEEKVTVALFSPNSTSFAIALLACLASPAGIIATLANSSYTASELRHQLQDARAGIILVHPSLLSVVEECLEREGGGSAGGWRERVYILGDVLDGKRTTGYRDFSVFRRGGEEARRLLDGPRPKPDDVAFLCYSSGTVSLRLRRIR